ALLIANKPEVQMGAIHYHRRYLLKVHTDNNLADPFTKALSKGKLTQHARSMGLLVFDGKTDIVNSKEAKDNSVIRNETGDIEEDMLNTDARKEDKDNSIVDDEDKNLNEITMDENVDGNSKNSNGHEETDINEGSSTKKNKDMECELEHNKSSKSFTDVIGKSVADFDKKLMDIPTKIDSNGVEIVVFDDFMIAEGSKKWEKTLCAYFVGYAWTIKGISALSSRIGKPLVMDVVTASMCKMGVGRVGFARVLVKVSTNKPLPYEIEVVYKNVDKEKTLEMRAEGSKQANEKEMDVRSTIIAMIRLIKMDLLKYNTRKKGNLNSKGEAKYAFQSKKKINNNVVSKESVVMPEAMNSQGNQKSHSQTPVKKA
ncbi:hypothetical protein Tco_1026678, partial [Tanacetum coccineum]